jgi:hypothetical protein
MPVCIGGRTWSNACMAGCAGVTGPSTPGECGSSSTGAGDKPVTLPGKAPPAKPCACPMIYAPLCFGGKTWGNRCEAECNGVDVSKATDGECKPTTAPAAPKPACPCPKNYAPGAAAMSSWGFAHKAPEHHATCISRPCSHAPLPMTHHLTLSSLIPVVQYIISELRLSALLLHTYPPWSACTYSVRGRPHLRKPLPCGV